jgi:hypothetical protein
MFLLAHENIDAVQDSLVELQGFGKRAITLLARCVEEQGIEVNSMSKAASLLDGAGYIIVRDLGDMWCQKFYLAPTLLGEEVLELHFEAHT